MDTKRCPRCNNVLPISDFGSHKTREDGVRRCCRKCEARYVRGRRSRNLESCRKIERESWHRRMSNPVQKQRHYQGEKKRVRKNKMRVIEYLQSHPCVNCGEADIVVLEFDHIDPSNKVKDIFTMVHHKYGWEAIKKEISKCEVVCGNCHARRTAKQKNYKKVRAGVCKICGETDGVILSKTKDGVMCVNCHRRHIADKQKWFKASVS